jgi:hypothetical protein
MVYQARGGWKSGSDSEWCGLFSTDSVHYKTVDMVKNSMAIPSKEEFKGDLIRLIAGLFRFASVQLNNSGAFRFPDADDVFFICSCRKVTTNAN